MAEHDPQAFAALFQSEPSDPTRSEVVNWIELYTQLTQLLDQQLRSTRLFSEKAPSAMRAYLEKENVKILAEELEVFKGRLGFWRGRTSN